ncbi:MAG: hypothetical protein GWN71_16015, partial [Gammaproteobacteria bacterium]|nr:hypothetical protein [Gemmatimonadota bacterium]NIU75027.1 hypothetical protein [Gammaproteobacteria bacterium]
MIAAIGGLVIFWAAGLAVASRPMGRPRILQLRSHSYRTRLTVVLGVFFFVPMIVYAGWGVVRLGAEADRSRDLVITQTLQDAALTAFDFAILGGTTASEELSNLADRLDADLLLYEG